MLISNRKANHEYHILQTFEAGIVLTGTEVKSLRGGKANLSDGWIDVENDEVYLREVHIGHYAQGNIFNHLEKRARKLLLSRKEIVKLQELLATKGLTAVPLKIYDKGRYLKLEIGVAKGKQEFDKRETEKKRVADRDMARAMRKR